MTALPAGPAAASPEAQALHDDAIVIDSCTFFFQGYNAMLREGGVTASVYTVALPMDDTLAALGRVKEYHRAVRDDPSSRIVRTASDLERFKADGVYGVIVGCQNARLIGTDLDWLEIFHQLGLRTLQLTYHERNYVGNGCLEPEEGGLSHFGRRVVREANRVGLTVDLSHASPRTCLEAIERSERPCIVSHAGVASVFPGPRSIDDEVMRALADAGGVFGVTTFPKVNWDGGDRRPSLDDFMGALERAIDTIGIDHVGIGTDYPAAPNAYPEWMIRHLAETYGPYREPAPRQLSEVLGGIDYHDEQLEGFAGIHHLPRITDALLQRGYGEDDIRKVLGGNFLRVFAETWG